MTVFSRGTAAPPPAARVMPTAPFLQPRRAPDARPARPGPAGGRVLAAAGRRPTLAAARPPRRASLERGVERGRPLHRQAQCPGLSAGDLSGARKIPANCLTALLSRCNALARSRSSGSRRMPSRSSPLRLGLDSAERPCFPGPAERRVAIPRRRRPLGSASGAGDPAPAVTPLRPPRAAGPGRRPPPSSSDNGWWRWPPLGAGRAGRKRRGR